MSKPLHVLHIDSSARGADSTSRLLGEQLMSRLQARHGRLTLTRRDLTRTPPPVVNSDWIAAACTDPAARDAGQQAALADSDTLIAELQAADLIVLGVPVYNFGIPAALKAWIDQVARARVTFRYTANGPEGLLQGKRAYLIVSSGGVAVDSDSDFATGYLRHVLGFLGIQNVEVIAADRQLLRTDALDQAQRRILDLLPNAA